MVLETPDVRSAPQDRASELRHLEEVLQSKCFERAPRLRSLLLYLWNNRNADISEYAIAVDALDRSSDFDPKIDATVRVQVARLRLFLRKYYAAEGSASSAWLTIPLGTHKVQVVEAVLDTASPDVAAPEIEPAPTPDGVVSDEKHVEAVLSSLTRPPRRIGVLTSILVTAVVLLAVCVGILLWMLTRRADSGPKNAVKQDAPIFWKSFMDNGKATRIVLPTPLFFSWSYGNGANTIVARDLSVNEREQMPSSTALADMERRYGKPVVWRQNYTFASDTFAALRLVHFLDSCGIQTSISSSAESPNAITDYENIVAFGTTSSLTAYKADLDRLSYKLAPYEKFIIDKRLPAGSPGQFPLRQESASRMVTPGLIALLPRGSSGGRILLVQGAETTALVSFITSENGLAELSQARTQHGGSAFFEAVVLSEVNGENPIQNRLVAFRTFTP